MGSSLTWLKTARRLLEGEAGEEGNRNYGWRAMEEQIEQNFGRRLAFILKEMKPSGGVRRIWSGLKLDLNRDTLADIWVLDFKVARVEAGECVKEEDCTSYLPTTVLGYVLQYCYPWPSPLGLQSVLVWVINYIVTPTSIQSPHYFKIQMRNNDGMRQVNSNEGVIWFKYILKVEIAGFPDGLDVDN